MHFTQSISTGVLVFATGAVAQLSMCDGNMAPIWEDCQQIAETLRGYSANLIPNLYPAGCTAIDPANGVDASTLQCTIRYCPSDASVQTTGTKASGDYDLVRINCGGVSAGGSAKQSDYYIAVTDNPNYKPSKVRRDASLERTHPRQLSKRQVPEGDDGFTLVTQDNNIELDGIQITGRLPAGSTYTMTQTDTQSTSVTTSLEVGASFFDFFSTSLSVSVTAEDSVSSSVATGILVDCDPGLSGQVFWYPLYNRYRGFTTPSQTNLDVTVPIDSSLSGMNYRIKCIA